MRTNRHKLKQHTLYLISKKWHKAIILLNLSLVFLFFSTSAYGQIDKATTKSKVITSNKVQIKSINPNEEVMNQLAAMEKITNQYRRLIVEESKQYAIGQYISALRLYKFDLFVSVNKNNYTKAEEYTLINNYLKNNIQKYNLRSVEYTLGIPNKIPSKEIKNLKLFDAELKKWEDKYLNITKKNQKNIDAIETDFNGTNQQMNQLNQMRATILRNMNEMRGIGASSKSGL